VGTVAFVASRDFDQRGIVVDRAPVDSPVRVTNPDEVAGLEGGEGGSHANGWCMARSGAVWAGFPGVVARSVRKLPACEPVQSSNFAKSGDRGAEVRALRVPEGFDQGMALERLLDDAALDPFPAAVDESDLAESGRVGRRHVFLDDRRDIAGREGMEVERVFDRDAVDHGAV